MGVSAGEKINIFLSKKQKKELSSIFRLREDTFGFGFKVERKQRFK